MRCSKCGRNLGLIAKFCPKCGAEVTAKQKKRSLIFFVGWLLGFLVLIPIFYCVQVDNSAFADFSRSGVLLISIFTAFIVIIILHLIYFIFYSLIRFIVRQPILGSIVVAAFLALIGFGAYLYITDMQSQKIADALSFIQDNLAETTVVKIMGDSLAEKKPLANASWERINMETQMISGRLKTLDVPEKLEGYKEAVIAWTDEVGIAALAPEFWGSVAENPGGFELKLSDKEAEQLFTKSVEKFSELKEFGDNAIKMENRPAMLFIGAKLRVARYWLNSILYSEKSGLFASDLISSVFASSLPPVPEVGPGRDVTCDICNSPNVKMTDYQRKMYNCDTRCKPSGQQNQPADGQQTQGQGGQTGKTGGNLSNQNNAGGSQGGGIAGSAGNAGNQAKSRQICIGRGGTGFGPVIFGSKPSNVYCVDVVIQSTSGIDASAINFARGKSSMDKNWENVWHNLEGMGVISTGEPATTENSPTVQKFYDECKAKGGTVGGAGIVKSRLPTTEFGYTCNYKINNNSTECWDFLTYSGGRYMGGKEGCVEKNLLPNVAKYQAEGGATGKWDGHYIGSAAASCTTDIPALPAFSYEVGMDFSIINNIANDTGVYVAIDDFGNAIEPVQLSITQNNVIIYLDAIFYYRFSLKDGGVAASVGGAFDMNINAPDNKIYYGSCKVTGSVAKQ